MMHSRPLSSGWQLKQRDPTYSLDDDFRSPGGWLPARVPGIVHQDLLAAGTIPDPFVGLNENAVQWIGECDWMYRCRFDLPAGFNASGTTVLRFDGLDTFATVWLNGTPIISSDNMFIPLRAGVGHLLRPTGNELRILFESPLLHGRTREAEHGQRAAWNGETSRLYVRKAQYHYGWDWGPTLLTAGPWRPVILEHFQARISDLHCPVAVAPDLNSALLPLTLSSEFASGIDRAGMSAVIDLFDPDGQQIDSAQLDLTNETTTHGFTIAAPRLWWPNGYGEQPLYRISAEIRRGSEVLDQRELRLGIRRLRLVQEPIEGEEGTSFVFEINNMPIFCGGANWIPADSFLPAVEPERYRRWVALARSANMTMLRVWGGGIYEDDIFYDACDEQGIMVWQDFMFGCGIYPAEAWFVNSVRSEAEAQLRRLRHHPSIVLWCGNNEDHMIAASLGVYDATAQGDFVNSRFPAREIYERVLPEVCATIDPTRPYWPGSPYGGADPNDPRVGDRHTWDVWHGRMAPYHDYPTYAGRFVSEFGMQAAPNLATVEAFASPGECYPQSRTFEHHNKASGGPRRLAVYLSDTVRMPANLEEYIYATQLVQAEALAAAIQGWRRRWGGPGRYAVAGALVWQHNDCWPVTSWALVDYALRPKAAYYVVRRALAPLVVGLARGAGGAEIWAVNGTAAPVEAELELRLFDLEGAHIAAERRIVQLAPNQTSELGGFSFAVSENLVLGAKLLTGGSVVARATLWPEPFKYLTLPDPLIDLHVENEQVTISAARPAKGVVIAAGDGIAWSDNMLDLLPGDVQVLSARGLAGRDVHARFLGQ